MKQKEVKARLCAITTDVMSRVFNLTIPADCICRREDAFYQFDERIITFIEQAVNKAIIEHKKQNK